MAGLVLGIVDGLVEAEVASGVASEHFQQTTQAGRTVLAFNEGCRGDGPGVDHRISRASGARLKADGIERIARGLHAHLADDVLASVIFERHTIDKRLGDGLDGEGLARIADLVSSAIGGDEGDAKPVGIGFREFGNVSGDFTLLHSGEFAVKVLEVVEHRRGAGGICFQVQGARSDRAGVSARQSQK